MQQVCVVFTAKEILQQIHRELCRLGADTVNIPVEKWQQYILARTIEEVYMVEMAPLFNPVMENIASLVRSNYRRSQGEELYTIHHDVGTNKLFPYLSSDDIPFESGLELHRNCVTIRPRETAE